MNTLAHYQHLASFILWEDGKPYRLMYGGRCKVSGSINGQGKRLLTSIIDGKKKMIQAHRLRWFMEYGWPVPFGLGHHDENKDNNRIKNLYVKSRMSSWPNNGDKYESLLKDGSVQYCIWINGPDDKARLAYGNCFQVGEAEYIIVHKLRNIATGNAARKWMNGLPE